MAGWHKAENTPFQPSLSHPLFCPQEVDNVYITSQILGLGNALNQKVPLKDQGHQHLPPLLALQLLTTLLSISQLGVFICQEESSHIPSKAVMDAKRGHRQNMPNRQATYKRGFSVTPTPQARRGHHHLSIKNRPQPQSSPLQPRTKQSVSRVTASSASTPNFHPRLLFILFPPL